MPFTVFVAVLLPRMLDPVSRSIVWYERSAAFMQALEQGSLADTYQQYHPGVAVMWIVGLVMKLVSGVRGITWADIERYRPDLTEVSVFALAVVIAFLVAMACIVLAKVTNPNVALLTGLLIAVDPYHITYSKVLHVDGLVASLIFLALVWLIAYAEDLRVKTLVCAGIALGFAVLTKVPSLLVCPVAALIVTYAHFADHQRRVKTGEAQTPARAWMQAVILRGLLLIVVICAVFVVGWPAMWVDASSVLQRIYGAVAHHVEAVHQRPIFWEGTSAVQDPGIPFYLTTLLWRTTPLMLTMAGVGALTALWHVRRTATPVQRTLFWSFVFAAYFAVQMGLSAKKSQRYILPLFPVVDLFAAVGLWRTASWLASSVKQSAQRTVRAVVWAGPIVLQTAVVIPYYPTFGLHVNALLGGARKANEVMAVQQLADGVTQAAEYLNTLPNAESLAVHASSASKKVLMRTFKGAVEARPPGVYDYRVRYLRERMRSGGQSPVDSERQAAELSNAVWRYEKDGIAYVWIEKAR